MSHRPDPNSIRSALGDEALSPEVADVHLALARLGAAERAAAPADLVDRIAAATSPGAPAAPRLRLTGRDLPVAQAVVRRILSPWRMAAAIAVVGGLTLGLFLAASPMGGSATPRGATVAEGGQGAILQPGAAPRGGSSLALAEPSADAAGELLDIAATVDSSMRAGEFESLHEDADMLDRWISMTWSGPDLEAGALAPSEGSL